MASRPVYGALGAHGGQVEHYGMGGPVGSFFKGMGTAMAGDPPAGNDAQGPLGFIQGVLGGGDDKGGGGGGGGLIGKVGGLAGLAALSHGGMPTPARPFAQAGPVPGQPTVPGKDTEVNDKVPALLTPKEIVLPLSVTQGPNPPEQAKKFVEHLTRRKSGKGYEKVLKARKKE
jgi:hypothetical protein